jgi:hypothetical protein
LERCSPTRSAHQSSGLRHRQPLSDCRNCRILTAESDQTASPKFRIGSGRARLTQLGSGFCRSGAGRRISGVILRRQKDSIDPARCLLLTEFLAGCCVYADLLRSLAKSRFTAAIFVSVRAISPRRNYESHRSRDASVRLRAQSKSPQSNASQTFSEIPVK